MYTNQYSKEKEINDPFDKYKIYRKDCLKCNCFVSNKVNVTKILKNEHDALDNINHFML